MIPIFFFKVHNFLNRIKKEYRLQRQIQIDELLMFFVVLFCIKKHTSKHGSVINAMQTCTSGPGDLILYEKSTKLTVSLCPTKSDCLADCKSISSITFANLPYLFAAEKFISFLQNWSSFPLNWPRKRTKLNM